jgi:hypothetical protein
VFAENWISLWGHLYSCLLSFDGTAGVVPGPGPDWVPNAVLEDLPKEGYVMLTQPYAFFAQDEVEVCIGHCFFIPQFMLIVRAQN